MGKETAEKSCFFDVVYLCKNTLFCFLATGILLLIGAVIATYLSLADAMTELLVMLLTVVCIFLGGFRSAKHAGRQGMIQGSIFGIIYMTCLTIAGKLICGDWVMEGTAWLAILIGVLCGAIGGTMGVNTKSKRKR